MVDWSVQSRRWLSLGCGVSLALVLLMPGKAAQAEEPKALTAAQTARGLEIFKKDVRLIIAHNCVDCHGGDAAEGEFDLSTREGLLKGGAEGKAIVPGMASASRLIKLISHESEPKMPEEADKLSDKQIALITEWVNLGAPYDQPLLDETVDATLWTERVVPEKARDYWAFQPLASVEPPQVKNNAWVRTPVDRFVLKRLEEKGITPNNLADKRRLLRRATLDLTGMPPTWEQAQAFFQDESPDAYVKLIDRLLGTTQYGERWARHWLDAARFAESHGFEQDYDRKYAYHFRDFVIKALNQDMPYDQFVRWQLAGDEIEPDNPLALMATGFLGAGVFPTQITANEVERTRYDALDDMTATVGSAMLGLTLGCARCHDHKYDPIPSADYYRMLSTFSTTVRSEIDLDLSPEKYKLEKSKFDKQHAPLVAALKKFEKEELPGRLATWEKNRPEEQLPTWRILEVESSKSAGGATFEKQPDGSLLVGGKNVDNDTYTFVVKTNTQGITAVRLEALAHPSMKKKGPGRAANGNFALSDFTVQATPLSGKDKPVALKLTWAASTFDQKSLPAAAAVDADPKSAWAVDPQFGKDHAAVFHIEGDIPLKQGAKLTFTLKFNNNKQHSIGRPRLSITSAPRPVGLKGAAMPANIVEALKVPALVRKPEQQAALLRWYATRDQRWQELNQVVQQSLAKAPKPTLTKVMVCSEGLKPVRHHTQGADFFEQSFFLRRGDTEKKEGVASQGFLQVLMRAPKKEKHWAVVPPKEWRTSYRRLALANWITDAEYGAGHLVARVIVNRLWHHHLGRGIVSTPNDFGVQGQRPTHPELLDWLATRLMAEGWRLKPIHKLIMTSSVYMQSSEFNAAKSKADLGNQWLWRRTPRRLEAEAIRDSMLSVSGILDSRMYGPGTLDEGHSRRSIYFMIKRSKLIPTMQLFDSPEPLSSVGRRPSTTVAPQALLFMNNPNVRRYAVGYAKRLAPSADKSLTDAVREGYQIAVAREPNEEELKDTVAFIKTQIKDYEAQKQANPLELALADFCQVLMSLNEFVYVD